MSKYEFDYNLRELEKSMRQYQKSLEWIRDYHRRAVDRRKFQGLTDSQYYWYFSQCQVWHEVAMVWRSRARMHRSYLTTCYENAFYDQAAEQYVA